MDESELRRRFAQLREADQSHAPGFAQTYACARRSWRAKRRMGPLLIGAAAAVAAVAIVTVWLVQARLFSRSPVAPTIASWRAPTDVLLRTPGSEVLYTMPVLSASVLDAMIPTSSKRGT